MLSLPCDTTHVPSPKIMSYAHHISNSQPLLLTLALLGACTVGLKHRVHVVDVLLHDMFAARMAGGKLVLLETGSHHSFARLLESSDRR